MIGRDFGNKFKNFFSYNSMEDINGPSEIINRNSKFYKFLSHGFMNFWLTQKQYLCFMFPVSV